jgi:multisubunit Na+/H+ antiporter MnhB subunit
MGLARITFMFAIGFTALVIVAIPCVLIALAFRKGDSQQH